MVPKAILITCSLLMIIGCFIQSQFIVIENKKKYTPAVILKGSASLIFVALGFICSKYSSDADFAKLVLIGLILGAVGDILLNLRFVFEKIGQKIFLAGIAAFLAGHILYLCALIPWSTSLMICLPVGVVLAGVILWQIFSHIEKVKPAFKIFGVVYIGAVVLMTSIAVGNLITAPSTTTALYATGAVLFTISDIVLIFNTFSSTQRFSLRITNLSLYYVGQLLIACSLMFA